MATNPYRAASAYRDHAVTTASPARLVVLIFERLTLDLHRALTAIDSGEHPHPHLIHAQELLTALLDALDTDTWEHAPQLAAIYTYLHRTLVTANVEQDAAKIHDCLAIITPLKNAWTHAANQAPESPPTRPVGVVNA